MNEEIWKIVPNTQGRYEVSSKGRVRSVERDIVSCNGRKYHHKENYLNLSNDVYGYPQIGIRTPYGTRLSLKIHRLVALLFIPNPDNKPEVNHINGIKNDNRVENLEWVTSRENKLHAIKMGLSNPTANLRYDNIPRGKERKQSKTLIVYYDGKEIARYTPVDEACKHGFPHNMIYKTIRYNSIYKDHYTFKTIPNEAFRK